MSSPTAEPKLSAIIIAFNESAKIGDCLKSVAFCDEVIVVDSGSTDATVEIAERHGARVFKQAWLGYGPQKDFALSKTTGEWVLWVDADERVTPELGRAIRAAIRRADANAYEFPRLASFCGRAMWHSGWYPGYVVRLFRRENAHFTDDLVHEAVIVPGPVRRLPEQLLHYPIVRLEDVLDRINRYSSLSAEMIAKSNRRVWFSTGITHGLWAFLRSYVFRLGFLDGPEGFLLAITIAEGSYYRYMKAWLLRRQQRRKG